MKYLIIFLILTLYFVLLTLPVSAAVYINQNSNSNANSNSNYAAGGSATANSGFGIPYTGAIPTPYQAPTPTPYMIPATYQAPNPTAQPKVMGYAPTTTQELPQTGPSLITLGLASLLPLGWKLKNLGSIGDNSSNFVGDIWNERFFKKLS